MINNQNIINDSVLSENEVKFVRYPKRNKIKGNTSNVFSWVLTVLLILYSVLLILMFLWCLMTSFKDTFDYIMNPFGLPKEWKWSNYSILFDTIRVQTATKRWVYMDEMFLNSLLYSLGCTIAATMTPCIVAYLTAKYKFRLNKIIHTIVIVAMILPIVGSLPSELQLVKTLGLYDHMWGMFILKANFLGMYFLVFYATFKSLPWTFAEAAQIDGAGHFRTFAQIMLPLIRSTLFAVFILLFIEHWNDYYTPMVFLPEKPTMSYGLFIFQTDNKASTPIQLAACILACVPILIVFAAFKDKIMSNVTMGGIKG